MFARLPEVVEQPHHAPLLVVLLVLELAVGGDQPTVGASRSEVLPGVVQRDGQTRLAAQRLKIAAGGVEDHPRIGEGFHCLRRFPSVQEGLPSQQLATRGSHQVVMSSVGGERNPGLFQRIVDVPSLEEDIRQSHPGVRFVLVRRGHARQDETPPRQLQSVVEMSEIEIHADGEVIHVRLPTYPGL